MDAVSAQNIGALARLDRFAEQVFHGNPIDMMLQGLFAALGAIASAWMEVNPFVGIYIALVVIDTILGVRVSAKEGVAFRWRRLLYGPGEKVVFGGLILLAAQFMEVHIPGGYLSHGMAAYMSGVLFLEAAGKYDKITGYNIMGFVHERLSAVVKRKKPVK